MGILLDVLTLGQQRAGGDIARGESEVAAKAEEAAGVSREADRKARLAEALASQNATAGARGVAAFEGSPLSVMQEDIRREAVATERDIFQTELRAKTIRARGVIAQRQAKTGAALGLLTKAEERITAAIKPSGRGGQI